MSGALVPLAVGLGLVAVGCGSRQTTSVGSTVEPQVQRWAKAEGFAGHQEALAGAKLFAGSGCSGCHTYLGSGSSKLGAPDLSAEGAKRRGVQAQVEFLRCPTCVHPGSAMPPFEALGNENLRKIAVFLEASKGKH
jgi:mono/diheme cytochrome c family protein